MLEAALGDVGHQGVAVAEMAVGRGRADAGLARGLGEGEARRALLGNQVEGGVDQRLAQVAVMIAAAPAAAVSGPAHGAVLAQIRAAGHTASGTLLSSGLLAGEQLAAEPERDGQQGHRGQTGRSAARRSGPSPARPAQRRPTGRMNSTNANSETASPRDSGAICVALVCSVLCSM